MDNHEGVLAGPMKAAALRAEWERRENEKELEPYPNLHAAYQGCMSGNAHEWLQLRYELGKIAGALRKAKQQSADFSSETNRG